MHMLRKQMDKCKELSLIGKILSINLGLVCLLCLYGAYMLYGFMMEVFVGGTSVQYIWNHHSSYVIVMFNLLALEIVVVAGFKLLLPRVDKFAKAEGDISL